MVESTVKATCRVCNKQAPAADFKLHYKLKQMVCSTCYRDKPLIPQPEAKKPKQEPPKPPGWDQEDEYLERVARLRKEQNQVQFTKIPGTNQLNCSCFKCTYEFRYDPFRKMPRTCPYCNAAVPALRTYNLL